jgi:hypothetical protein
MFTSRTTFVSNCKVLFGMQDETIPSSLEREHRAAQAHEAKSPCSLFDRTIQSIADSLGLGMTYRKFHILGSVKSLCASSGDRKVDGKLLQGLACRLGELKKVDSLGALDADLAVILESFSEAQLQQALRTLSDESVNRAMPGNSAKPVSGLGELSAKLQEKLVKKATNRMFDQFVSGIDKMQKTKTGNRKELSGADLQLKDVEGKLIELTFELNDFLGKFDSKDIEKFELQFIEAFQSKFQFAETHITQPMISATKNKKLFHLSPNFTLKAKSTGVVITAAVDVLDQAFKGAAECIALRKSVSWESKAEKIADVDRGMKNGNVDFCFFN